MTRFALTLAIAVLAFFGAVPLSGCGKGDKKTKEEADKPNTTRPNNTTDADPKPPVVKPADSGSVSGNFTLAVTSGNERVMLNSKYIKKDKVFHFSTKNPSDEIEKELKKFDPFSAAIELNSVNMGMKAREGVYDSMTEHLIFRYSPVVAEGKELKHRMTQLFTNEAAKAANEVDGWAAPVSNALRKLTTTQLEEAIRDGGPIPDDFPSEFTGEILYNLLHTFTESWANLKNKGYKAVLETMTKIIKDKTGKARETDRTDVNKIFTELFSTEEKEQAKQMGIIHGEIIESKNLSYFDILNSSFLYVRKDLLRSAVGTDAPQIYVSPDVELSNDDEKSKKLEQIEKFDNLVPKEAINAKAGFAVLFLNKNKCVAFVGINSDSKYTKTTTEKKKEGLSKQVKNVMTFAKEKCTAGGVAYLMGDFGLLSVDTLERFLKAGEAKLSDPATKDEFKKALEPVMDMAKNFYSECRQGTPKELSPRTKSEEKDKVYENIKPYEDYESIFGVEFDGTVRDDLKALEVASDKRGVMMIPIIHQTVESIEATAEKGESDMMKNPVLKFDINIRGETKVPRGAPGAAR